MAKPELGTKRVCGNCGAKFYDLARSPIVCPKCNSTYEVAAPTRAASRAAAAAAAAAPAAAAVADEADMPVAGAEVISLEEADAENTGRKTKVAPADGDVDIDTDDVEIEPGDEDDTFLEEEEEEAGNVSDIIGEKVEGDDET